MQDPSVAYNNNVSEETVTNNLVGKIQNANNRQKELVYSIEDKLHSILNLRQPQPQPTPESDTEKLLSDFSQAMDNEINLIQISNYRLENILSHLRKIV